VNRYLDPATYRNTRQSVDRAMTLIPDAYRNPEFYELELQQVWEKS